MAAVRRFEDFDYWKLANELKLAIYELSERADVKPDRDAHRAFGPDPRTLGPSD